MLRSLMPIVLVVAAIGLFYTYIDPTYQNIKMLQAEEAKYDEALVKSRELQALRDELLSKYNTFSQENLEQLHKLLPDHVDNVRLTLDIDSMAAQYNMRINNITVSSERSAQAQSGAVGPEQQPYNSTILSFDVSSTYENIQEFLHDLERSLRVVDVTELAFNPSQEGDLYTYRINIRTYWLR